MALSRDIYRELEDILGPANISEDLAIIEAYTNFPMGATGPEPEDRYLIRPEAVALPGSTSEVQAIVRVCNRRKIKFKASSTAYAPFGAVGSEGVIFLDMRRMNRVLEIDEKNMYAIVEPYVSFAQLQGEAMKRGLNCHVIGAGSNCSVLASTTSLHGTNTQAISQGYGGRNLISAEWVLPTGEIIRLGASGSLAGWFSGDGPGPSLRGIVRGHTGAQGGLGVFTKCAVHLHPWFGPPKMELTGVSPYYETKIPPNFEYHVLEWPTWDQCADAVYKIGEAGIAFAIHKTGGPGSHGTTVTGNNNEYYAKYEDLKDLPWISFAIVTAGASDVEHTWQVKTLDRILEETGGKIIPVGEKPIWKKRDYINMVRGCFIPRSAFRAAGSFACPLNGADSIDHSALGLSFDKEFRKKYEEKGLLFNDGTNNMWGIALDGGHYSLFECGHLYNPNEAASWKGADEMQREGQEIQLKTPLAIEWGIGGEMLTRMVGPFIGNPQNWTMKIKKALDPNIAADPSGYIVPD